MLSCLIFSHLAFYMQWFELFNINGGMSIQTKHLKNVDIAMTSSSPNSWSRSWLSLCLQYRRFPYKSFRPLSCYLSWQIFPVVSPSLGCSDHSPIYFKIDASKRHLLMSHFIGQFFNSELLTIIQECSGEC